MIKVKKLSLLIAFFALFAAFTVSGGVRASAKAETYCIEATPEISEKAFEYLDEIYIEKYPDFALEFPFGSEGDRKVLKAAADKITKGAKTDREKVEKIVKWVCMNIDYRSYTTGEGWVFAIDTYYNKKGNCVGTSQLILNLCRLSGIRAVMCCGPRGDMEILTLENKEPDHAWTMIYIDGEWYLYDPLFDVYGVKDKKYIDKWYFFDFIEGVSPYVEKYAEHIFTGDCIFYIDGKFIHYKNGVPSSEFYEYGTAYCGSSINSTMPYFSRPHSTGSGWVYVENPERKDTMSRDECYSDGWIKYGNSLNYANPNSIYVGAKIIEHEGKSLYFSYMSGAVILPGRSEDYTLTDGYVTMLRGQKLSVTPYWKEEELKKGRVIVWEAVTPETATVSKDGVITALEEGMAIFTVSSRDEPDGGNHMSEIVQVSVLEKNRTVSYSFSVEGCGNNGHTYTDACDTTCNVCEAVRTVTHSLGTITTKATLTKNGKQESKCSLCGYVSKKTTIYYPKTIKLSATKYSHNGKVKTPTVTVKDSKGKTLKENIDYTVKYASGRKNIGKYAVTITFEGKYSGTKKLYFNIIFGKTSKITATNTTTSIKATWKKVTGAVGYKVELLNSKGKALKTVTTKKLTYTFKKLSKVTTYKIRVTAYKTKDSKKVYSTVSTTLTTSTAPAKTTLSKVTSGSKKATAAWKTVKSASGYEVQYSTSSKFKSAKTATVKKGSSKKTTIKKLTKGKKYYFMVRAYKTVDGKKVYGAWSSVKNVKIK